MQTARKKLKMLSTGTTAKRVHSLKRTRINSFSRYLTIEYAESVLLPESVIVIHKSTLRTCIQSAFSMPENSISQKNSFFISDLGESILLCIII